MLNSNCSHCHAPCAPYSILFTSKVCQANFSCLVKTLVLETLIFSVLVDIRVGGLCVPKVMRLNIYLITQVGLNGLTLVPLK